MKSIKKRLVALLMTLVMTLGISASAFAAEPTDVITADSATSVSEEASTRSTGGVIAAGTTTIQGGYGSLAITLSGGNFWADLVAQIDYIAGTSLVEVSVITPDGDFISLGHLTGSGSRTYPYELFYAPAGTYTFTFYTTVTSPFDVTVFIYD